MRHLMLILQYRGTNYCGFQVQPNGVSVAQVVQDAIETVFKRRWPVKGCSRTDAGVHANHFVLAFFTDAPIPCDAVVRALNIHLPPDVAVLDCREVPEGFHPRYDCTGKRYLYQIWNSPVKNPFLTDLALYHKYRLDLPRMQQAADRFVGTHDFSAFCSAGSTVQDTVRTITEASIARSGEMVAISVTGSGFLYNMVRIMVGTLLEVGVGAILPEEISGIIESRDRSRAGATAPPHGLYLDMVFYH